MDVDFTILSPEGVLLITETRRSDGVHVWVQSHSGSYFISQLCRICLFDFLLLSYSQGGAHGGGRLSDLLWQQLQPLLREDGVLRDHHRGSGRRRGWRWRVGGVRGAWRKPAGVQARRHPGEMHVCGLDVTKSADLLTKALLLGNMCFDSIKTTSGQEKGITVTELFLSSFY